jgi:hypothetical protein
MPYWLCKCDCGNEKIVSRHLLRSGDIQSCGCLRKEIIKKKMTTHNQKFTRLYAIWCGMKQRCYNPHRKEYRLYGGRGIKMDDSWASDFKTFYKWAMANGYNDTLSIERIDVNGNYCPENCKWITLIEQADNKQNSKKIYCVELNKTYANAKIASKDFNVTPHAIRKACRENQRSANYHFKYV